jgi:ribosome-associated toxin RatA of RatAB toxin-antitoxin module
MALVDGPFSHLDGTWSFLPLGPAPEDGGGPPACKVELDLAYAFKRGALEALISPVFDRVANTFVDSFVKRAETVYGES